MELTAEDLETEYMSSDLWNYIKPNEIFVVEIEPHTTKFLFWKKTHYRLFAKRARVLAKEEFERGYTQALKDHNLSTNEWNKDFDLIINGKKVQNKDYVEKEGDIITFSDKTQSEVRKRICEDDTAILVQVPIDKTKIDFNDTN